MGLLDRDYMRQTPRLHVGETHRSTPRSAASNTTSASTSGSYNPTPALAQSVQAQSAYEPQRHWFRNTILVSVVVLAVGFLLPSVRAASINHLSVAWTWWLQVGAPATSQDTARGATSEQSANTKNLVLAVTAPLDRCHSAYGHLQRVVTELRARDAAARTIQQTCNASMRETQSIVVPAFLRYNAIAHSLEGNALAWEKDAQSLAWVRLGQDATTISARRARRMTSMLVIGMSRHMTTFNTMSAWLYPYARQARSHGPFVSTNHHHVVPINPLRAIAVSHPQHLAVGHRHSRVVTHPIPIRHSASSRQVVGIGIQARQTFTSEHWHRTIVVGTIPSSTGPYPNVVLVINSRTASVVSQTTIPPSYGGVAAALDNLRGLLYTLGNGHLAALNIRTGRLLRVGTLDTLPPLSGATTMFVNEATGNLVMADMDLLLTMTPEGTILAHRIVATFLSNPAFSSVSTPSDDVPHAVFVDSRHDRIVTINSGIWSNGLPESEIPGSITGFTLNSLAPVWTIPLAYHPTFARSTDGANSLWLLAPGGRVTALDMRTGHVAGIAHMSYDSPQGWNQQTMYVDDSRRQAYIPMCMNYPICGIDVADLARGTRHPLTRFAVGSSMGDIDGMLPPHDMPGTFSMIGFDASRHRIYAVEIRPKKGDGNSIEQLFVVFETGHGKIVTRHLFSSTEGSTVQPSLPPTYLDGHLYTCGQTSYSNDVTGQTMTDAVTIWNV